MKTGHLATPTFGPRCPNHNELLEGIGFPIPQKGTGRCPVSKCMFAFEISVDEMKMIKDKEGKMVKAVGWKTEGNEDKN